MTPVTVNLSWRDIIDSLQFLTKRMNLDSDQFIINDAEVLEKIAQKIRQKYGDKSLEEFNEIQKTYRHLAYRSSYVRNRSGRSDITGIPTQLLPIYQAIDRYEGHIYPSCVYFLCQNGLIVYVGQTTNIAQRIGEHLSSGKIFDEVFTLPIHPSRLRNVEDHYIALFDPIYNGSEQRKRTNSNKQYPIK